MYKSTKLNQITMQFSSFVFQGLQNCIIRVRKDPVFLSLILMTLCFASGLSNLLTAGSNPNHLAIRLFLMSMKCHSHAQHNGLSLMLHKTALLSQSDRIGRMQRLNSCAIKRGYFIDTFSDKKVRFASGGFALKLCEL